jgi:hypothetical protein
MIAVFRKDIRSIFLPLAYFLPYRQLFLKKSQCLFSSLQIYTRLSDFVAFFEHINIEKVYRYSCQNLSTKNVGEAFAVS